MLPYHRTRGSIVGQGVLLSGGVHDVEEHCVKGNERLRVLRYSLQEYFGHDSGDRQARELTKSERRGRALQAVESYHQPFSAAEFQQEKRGLPEGAVFPSTPYSSG